MPESKFARRRRLRKGRSGKSEEELRFTKALREARRRNRKRESGYPTFVNNLATQRAERLALETNETLTDGSVSPN